MMGLPDHSGKGKLPAEDIMGYTSGPHAKVTPGLVRQIIESVTGKAHCPACPPPCKRPPLKAVKVEELVPGLSYEYYEGTFSAAQDFANIRPAKTGRVPTFNLSIAKGKDRFAVVFTGYIRVAAEGCYTFSLRSDNASRLMIGNNLVVENDGWWGTTRKTGRIKLKAGLHALKLVYVKRDAGEALEVRYSAPGIRKQIIPASGLLRKPPIEKGRQ